jgi:hypothetical protein
VIPVESTVALVFGALIGAYLAWGLTVLWFDAHGPDTDEGDGGIDVPDLIPDDWQPHVRGPLK